MTLRQHQTIDYLNAHLFVPDYNDENPWKFDISDARWRFEERVRAVMVTRGIDRFAAEEIVTEIVARQYIDSLPEEEL